MDPSVQEAIGNVLLGHLEAAEEKVDEEIRELDAMGEDDFEALRRRRLAQLKKNQKKKQEWIAQGHGSYNELPEEKVFFDLCKKSHRVVAAFGRPATRRTEIVDKHLSELAPKHIETKFLKINAEKCPFLCERLRIWMLPTMVLIKGGKTEHSIVGFDDLGGGDDFPTEVLERFLVEKEILLESMV